MKNLSYVAVVLILVVILGGYWYIRGQKVAVEPKVKCPVMGTEILPGQAFSKTEYKGQTYYFCCEQCPEEFKLDPEKYSK